MKVDREKQEKIGGILHIVGNVVGVVLIAVLLPIMAINLTLIVKSYVHKDKVPTVFGVAPLIVMSGSMDPTIQVNDLVFTKEVKFDSLKVGDIIAFQSLGAPTVVTHRIYAIRDDGSLTTKGDWNNTPDKDPVWPGQLVGLYFHRFPGVGEIALFLQQPVGMIIFVAIPLVLFIAYDLTRRTLYNRKHKKDEDAEKEELERLRAMAAALAAGEVPAMPIAAAAEPVEDAYPPFEGEPEAAPEPEPEAEPEADLDADDADEV